MTEEEMDYQIELNELYSNKNDSVENPKMWTIDELDKEIDKTTKYLEKLWSAREEKK